MKFVIIIEYVELAIIQAPATGNLVDFVVMFDVFFCGVLHVSFTD